MAAALPIALAKRGHTVSRIMPMYRPLLEHLEEYSPVEEHLTIPIGHRRLHGDVYKHTQQGVTSYFIRRDEFFDRSELYSTSRREYDDNADRFIFFQKAAVELSDLLKIKPDIVHCNDWQTGLIPLYLRHGTRGEGRGRPESTVFTIHNLAYQGIFGASEFPSTSLPFSCFTISNMEYYGNMSFLKAGITSSDRITTVSETYAREIQTHELGFGLDGVLRERSSRIHGIVNGVDYTLWNPNTDPVLAATYSERTLKGKASCKADLQKRCGLPVKAEIPLMGMVVRLVDQKGLDILSKAMDDLMKRSVQFVLLGSGQQQYEEKVQEWNDIYSDRFHGTLGYDSDYSHRIEAGADLYCMPSRFEPCGLNQLYSLKYGTVPVVYRTGGLADTVVPVSGETDGGEGTGYAFETYSPDAFLAAVDVALSDYAKPERWKKIMKRGMKADFSWNTSAEKYEEVYRQAISGV